MRESRSRGRLLARNPRRVEPHSAPARTRGPLVNGNRDAARMTVGCSPRKRQGAVVWMDAAVMGSPVSFLQAAIARRDGRAITKPCT